MSWTELPAVLKKYGLAICCVVAPLLLGYWAPNFVGEKLLPKLKPDSLPICFLFETPESPPTSDKDPCPPTTQRPSLTVADGNATPGAEKAKALAAAELNFQKAHTERIANALAGRYGYVAASGFFYLLSFIAFILAAAIIVFRAGWTFLAISTAVFLVLALRIAAMPTAYDTGGDLVLTHLLNAADKDGLFKSLIAAQPAGFSIAQVTRMLIQTNTFVVIWAVGLVLIAFAILAIRDDRQISEAMSPERTSALQAMRNDLAVRMHGMRALLLVGSAILVLGVLASKALLEWPLKLLISEQRAVLEPLANAVTTHLGATGTMALFAVAIPALAAWRLDVARYRELVRPTDEPPTEPPKDGLELASVPMLNNVVLVLAPLMTTPIANLLTNVGALFK